MEFRPCIDIHNGKVKQIVGGSLKDEGSKAAENFVSGQDAAFFARLYQGRGIRGGHIILLNPAGSQWYEATKAQALGALAAYPGGMQVGGGICPENAEEFLRAGASHVIVTSYVFRDGAIRFENLEKLRETVGKEHLVLDLSCRKREGSYYIVTDRWLLGNWGKIPVTYAGGVGNFSDLDQLKRLGKNRLNVTIGSALDLFGGDMAFEEVLEYCNGTGKKAGTCQ